MANLASKTSRRHEELRQYPCRAIDRGHPVAFSVHSLRLHRGLRMFPHPLLNASSSALSWPMYALVSRGRINESTVGAHPPCVRALGFCVRCRKTIAYAIPANHRRSVTPEALPLIVALRALRPTTQPA